MISIDTWRKRGELVSTPDGRVWAMQSGPRTGTPIVLLHGFPTSSWDFAEVATALAARRPVVTFDFLGFGFSDKPRDYGYSLMEQADVALAVLRHFRVEKAHLVAHDMGTSVCTELLARKERGILPVDLASFSLMNGSVHVEMAHLTFGQKALRSPLGKVFARLNTRATFKAQMRRIFAKAPTEMVLDGMWDLMARDEGIARLPSLIHYVDERSRFARRWIGALERTRLRALIAWGEKDPVAVLPIAKQLAQEIPGARLVTWPDLGHYPQVEDAARVTSAIESFLDAS